ncbi:MAG: hypothetical protein R2725_13465 [Solirubrobacterales bacterium]
MPVDGPELTDDDRLCWTWEDPDGALRTLTVTLEEAEAMKRGERFVGHGVPPIERLTLGERIAALRARRSQLEERMAEMKREFPGIEHGEWSP